MVELVSAWSWQFDFDLLSLLGWISYHFSDRVYILKNVGDIYWALDINRTYILHPKVLVEPLKEEEKLRKKSIISIFLQQYGLGDMSLIELMDLSAIGILKHHDFQFYPSCLTCKEMIRMSSESIERKNGIANDCLDLLHIDVMGPMHMKIYHKIYYFVSFAYTCSKFCCVYMLCNMP